MYIFCEFFGTVFIYMTAFNKGQNSARSRADVILPNFICADINKGIERPEYDYFYGMAWTHFKHFLHFRRDMVEVENRIY